MRFKTLIEGTRQIAVVSPYTLAGLKTIARMVFPLDFAGFIRAKETLINVHGTQVAIAFDMETHLKVMVIDADSNRRAVLVQSLQATGYSVIDHDALTLELVARLESLRPDVIVIDADAPDRDMLEHLCMISRDQPHPIVMFTDDDDASKIKQAIRAGVTSYVVKGIDPARLKPILQVAIARFEEHQTLRRDLSDAQTQLASRKVIERAKGIVMKQKNIDEDEAYRLLRKMAMDRNAKLADVAEQIVGLSEAFT